MSESKKLTTRGIHRAIPNPEYESNAIKSRRLEHQIEIDDRQIENDVEEKKQAWKSFCFTVHADSMKFFAKVLISSAVIALCSYQLINVEDCHSQNMYSGLLGTILGSYLK